MAIKDLDGIVRTHSGNNPLNISFGLRPSGTIHLGNMMTMALASGVGRKIGPHLAKLNVTICDLDLPDQRDWNIHANGYAKHYRDIKDRHGCHESMAEHATEEIKTFLDSLQKVTGVQYSFKTLTEVQRDPNFRLGLKRILDDPEATRLIIPDTAPEMVYVYPLCPSCNGSYTGIQKNKSNTYREGVISTYCSNPECDRGGREFKVNVLDPSIDLAVHLFIDPMRDALVQPYSQVHVFGGDYSAVHGSNKVSKVEKILALMKIAAAGSRLPDILVGPTIYSRDGEKMSKQKDNGLNAEHLKQYLGSDYPRVVLDFTMGLVEEGFKNVDYQLIAKSLLAPRG